MRVLPPLLPKSIAMFPMGLVEKWMLKPFTADEVLACVEMRRGAK